MRLPPHRIEGERRLVSTLRSLGPERWRLELVKVDIPCHGVEEVDGLQGWIIVSGAGTKTEQAIKDITGNPKSLTGFECHLSPPNSNQLKCPPPLVAHITT